MTRRAIIAVVLALAFAGTSYAVPTRAFKQAVTLSGAGTVTIGSRPYVEVTCANGSGCAVTLATYAPASAQTQIEGDVTIVCLNAYLSGAVCTFANQAGLVIVPSGGVSLDNFDVLRLGLTGGQWLAIGTSNNVPPTATPTSTPTPSPTPTNTP